MSGRFARGYQPAKVPVAWHKVPILPFHPSRRLLLIPPARCVRSCTSNHFSLFPCGGSRMKEGREKKSGTSGVFFCRG